MVSSWEKVRDMGVQVEMRVAELLCSRLCHDLVGPVSAINHGCELIADSGPQMVAEAGEMTAESARQASNRLQFFRVAFGLSGGGTGQMSMAEGRKLAKGFIERHIELDWPINPDLPWADQAVQVPKDVIKVILNLLMLSIDCLPRGGHVAINQAVFPEGLGIAFVCNGQNAEIREEIASALNPQAQSDQLSARTVQAFFLARLVDDLGLDFEFSAPQSDMVQLAVLIPLDL